MRVLSEEQVAQWRRDGFLSPFPLLSAEEVQTCRDGVQRFETWLGGRINSTPEMKWRTMPYLILPWAAKLARDATVLDVVEDVLGADILIFTSTFFIKEPHSPTIAAWHQDATYFGTGAERVGYGVDCDYRSKHDCRLHGGTLVQTASPVSCATRRALSNTASIALAR